MATATLSRALAGRTFWKTREWWLSDREPTLEERDAVLRIPGLVGVATMGFWLAIAAGGVR